MLLLAAATAIPGAATAAPAPSGWVRVRAQRFTPHYRAYARVAPISLLPVRAPVAGQVSHLAVRPGDHVTARQPLLHLSGPRFDAMLARRRSALDEADASLRAARKSLTVERQKRRSHLSTRRRVAEAEAAVSKARAAVTGAQAALKAAQAARRLRAPLAGTVVSVPAADGERVNAGDRLLTLQPAHALWLRATYYGSDLAAIHPGMRGRFMPADGGKDIPVRVRSVFAQQRDGGQGIGLEAVGSPPHWVSGEAGTVELNGAARGAVAVPSRALVLDQGQWWVLLRGPHGARRQAVTPGPSRGEKTFVLGGLKPGEQVLATHAYLTFHRQVSRHYEPPD